MGAGLLRRVLVVAVAAAVVSQVPGWAALGASGSTRVVESVHNPRFGFILADTQGKSLYLLTSEAHHKFTCTNVCTVFWPPLLVPAGTTKVSGGPGVAGKVGTVRRPEGTTQVTFNGYPVYYYISDTRQGDTGGEGVQSFGGTWFLLNPKATKQPATAVRRPSP